MLKSTHKVLINLVLMLLMVTCTPEYKYHKYKKNNPTPAPKYFTEHYPKLDSEIAPIFEIWVNESIENKTNPNWSNVNFITFSDTLSYMDFAGLQIDGKGIYISKDYQNSQYLKIILYHELGHGMFSLPHDTSKVNIMGSYFNEFIGKIYLTNWEYYKNLYWEHIVETENK